MTAGTGVALATYRHPFFLTLPNFLSLEGVSSARVCGAACINAIVMQYCKRQIYFKKIRILIRILFTV